MSAASQDEKLQAIRDAEEDAELLKAGSRGFRETFSRLMGRVFRHRAILSASILLMLVGTAASLSGPYLLGYAIDHALVPKDRKLLVWITLIYLSLEMLRYAATIAYAYLFESLGQKVMQELRVRLFTHLQALPVSIFDRTPVGRLVTRVTNDIAALSEMFSIGFVSMIANLLLVFGILIWLFVLDWRLALTAGTMFPVLALASIHFSRKLQVAYRNTRTRLSALNAFLAESLLGMKILQLFGRDRIQRERLDRITQEYADAQISSVKVFALFQPTITWCSGIAVAISIAYGGYRVSEGAMALGVLVAFFSYLLLLFQPVREITDKWNVILSGVTAAERIFSILSWKTEMEPDFLSRPAARPSTVRGEIVFENVWFAYEGERWVLKDFSFVIPAGSRIGVVGHTGAGKTTVISLLLRFHDPQRGRILLDGRDLREFDRRELRSIFGIIQQDGFLFSGTVRENATLWREDLPDSASKALARIRGVNADSPLLERGSNLSMGERQLLAFARALASKPSVWILDEATSNVDSSSERELGQILGEYAAGCTTLLIAHRLATVRDADRILVLHHGELREQGTHTELMRADGLYARLYRYQDAIEATEAGEVAFNAKDDPR